MEKSFGNLLRHSKLASFDRSLNQVYKSPKKFRNIGDWGLKRNLPTVIRTQHVTIGGLDTVEHQTPWESGETQVLFIKRWKENFPNSKKPTPRTEEIQHSIANMTPAEFQRFLRHSQKKASEFQEALRKKELVPEQVFDYLKVNLASTAVEDTEKSGQGIVGPTYSDNQVGWDYPVQGRILNQTRLGFHVGIGGVVAMMPKRAAIGLNNSGLRDVRTFYVHHAELDEQGKPKVELGIRSDGASSPIPLLNDYESYNQFEYRPSTYNSSNNNKSSNNDRFNNNNTTRSKNKSTFWNVSADEMMNKPYRSRHAPESDDNIKPNPEHLGLMARIASLLETNKKQ